MALYAIADLHLSKQANKPMDIFGAKWSNHDDKIRQNWLETVKTTDTVLIPGDISWAMNLKEAIEDLKWIDCLPGNKILVKGNHDYWWSAITKLNLLFDSMYFLQNNFFIYENYAVCGTRGWICPNSSDFTERDEKIYHREINRIKTSLNKAVQKGYEKIIAMLHFPPTNDSLEPSLFTQTFEEYNVEKVVYGHLHSFDSYKAGLEGVHNKVLYQLVSCDYLDFKLYKVL